MDLTSAFFAKQIGLLDASRLVLNPPPSATRAAVQGRLTDLQGELAVGLHVAGLRNYSAQPSVPSMTHPMLVECLRSYEPRASLPKN